MSYLKLLYILTWLCFSLVTKAQSISFENFTTRDGLLSDEVFNIHQDKKGYVWLFTNYGAMKYNGKLFAPALTNLSFNESFIYSIYENKLGQKWVANSKSKIYEIRNDSAYLVIDVKEISKKNNENIAEIFQLFVDDSLNIYAITRNHSYKFLKQKKYNAICLSKTIPSDSILVRAIEIDKVILPVTNYKGLAFYLPENYKKTITIQHLINNTLKTSYTLNYGCNSWIKYIKRFGNKIYVTFCNKVLSIYDNGVVKEIPVNAYVLNFTKDQNNHLWVACYNNGLYELDENDSIINHYFSGKTINDVLCDSQGGLWASSEGLGLFHCKNINEFSYNKTEPLGLKISLIKQIDNKLFVSNVNGDAFDLNGDKLELLKKRDEFPSQAMDIFKYKNNLFLTTKHKIQHLYPTDFNFKIDSEKFTGSYKVFNIGNDSLIFLKRSGAAVYYKDRLLKYLQFKLKTHDISFRDEQLLFATENGICILNADSLYQPLLYQPTEKCAVTKIIKDSFKNYWFCSKGYGLFKLSPNNTLQHYTVTDGLPSNIVNDISVNAKGGILLSTNKGLFYSLSTNLKGVKWKEIYSEEVYSALNFNNKIYLGTNNGLVYFNENYVHLDRKTYFNLTSVIIDSVNVSINDLMSLNYKKNNLIFNFDVISSSLNTPNVTYKLIGKDEITGVTDNQQIIFQKLPPGDYSLIVTLNTSHQESIMIPFRIIPAFWQTLWFKVIAFLTALLIIIYIVWLYFRYRKIKEEKKNSVDRLITEYKLVALKAQINPHFMSNCLTAIQHLIISNKVEAANQYLAKFSLLVRQVLNFSSKPLVSLQEELNITELNIELEQLRFENKFVFEMELEEKYNLKSIFIPPLILQPIIENAIWHGLLPLKKTGKGKLLLKINIIDDLLHIIIEDNGVGRKKNNNSLGNIKESKGISITQQRIDNLNNFHNNNMASLQYEDLVDDRNNAIGTRVVVTLPINLSPEIE